MADLKFEVGKCYRTRSGKKVIIHNVDLGRKKLLLSGLEDTGDYDVYFWCKDGSFFERRGVSNHDLVAEWEEEPVKLEAWYQEGRLFFWEANKELYDRSCAKRVPWLDPPKDWKPE